MSSDADFIAFLQLFVTSLYKFGGSALIGLGILGNVISLVVFTKKNLRKNPCSVYFVAVNIANLLLLLASFLLAVLRIGFNVDPSSTNAVFCHFRFYAFVLFDVLSPTYLIFASIDRVLFTSSNALTRQKSTARLAYTCIICITLFWLICHSHAFVFTSIVQILPGYFVCYLQFGTYLTVMSYYLLIIKGILVPLFMAVLGLWTVKNVQKVGRVVPVHDLSTVGSTVNVAVTPARSKDHQLIRILLVDIGVYIIFNCMISVVLMYAQVTQYQSKSVVQTRLDGFLQNVGTFSTYIPFCIGCYTNMLVSKTFRNEVRKFLMCQ